MSFGEMCPIFGRLAAEWSQPAPHATPLAPFLFHVRGNVDDRSALRVIATDFQSNTFQGIKSRQQLEDLRDDTGIGGPWSDFVVYITTSLKTGDVKLIMEGSSESGGAFRAKLIAQKSKGMPRFSISLGKLVNGPAGEAMASLSLELYKEFKDVQSSLVKEQESKYRLTNVVAAEQTDDCHIFCEIGYCQFAFAESFIRNLSQEKNATLQKQLDMALYSRKHKSQKINDGSNSDSISAMVSQDSAGKHTANNASSTKGASRVVPAYRRSKVRGAVLDDTDDDAQN